MGIRTDKWAIAYRKKKGSMLDDAGGFTMIPQDYKGFYADPFLFEHDGKTYLFAEYYEHKINRGYFVYAVYDAEKNAFSDFKEIIREDYHLSYPLVFRHKGEIYIMPEAGHSDTLYLYRATRFPDEWEKAAVLLDGIKLADTTPFDYHGRFYAVTKCNRTRQDPMLLLRIDPDQWSVTGKTVVTDDISVSRPGGHVIRQDERYYLVTQDCQKDYGTALNFLEFSIDGNDHLEYRFTKKITPDHVGVDGVKTVTRIHTYNFTEGLEVIDFKYPITDFYRAFWLGVWRIKNKFKK